MAFIVKEIRTGASEAENGELVPVLECCLNSYAWDDATGRTLEHIPFEHFLVVWRPQEAVAEAAEVNILGTTVFVYSETMSRLVGNQLVLRVAEPGERCKLEASKQLLMVVPKQ
jgi:hypothetical protein